MSLTLDIVDILDELNMLLLVLEQQINVLLTVKDQFQNMKSGTDLTKRLNKVQINVNATSLGNLFVDQPRNGDSETEIRVDATSVGNVHFKTSDTEGTMVAKSIRGYAGRSMREADKLLRSETANLTRLRSDAKQLPLSFFSSYFGQNVSEFTGSNQNPSSGKLWRIAGKSLVLPRILGGASAD
ncbi:hypothetical protein J4E83_009146 [Alternaria metachromatica]|uniref:uncharacterized protein n=1 Tax=Alternaria metachromatica TaxID=283354 RepID=UPI0020C409FE|nr:uncharacterized protein J4E83_009146 [Alternaria metachromatica]KAI4608344.1 hypothetical protein J4E83_009146 [Alternaria metachromatica]